MSISQAQQAGFAGSLRNTSFPNTPDRGKRDGTTAGDPDDRVTKAGGAGIPMVAKGPDRHMNAFPPKDSDRNPDFDAIVDEYYKKIYNVIYRFINDHEEATDLTQETFVSAFRHYEGFRGDAKVFTWLFQIARNLCINRVRQRDRQRNLKIESLDQSRDSEDDDGLTRDVADWSHSPQQVLEEKELQQKILAAIDSLPVDYKEVVLLREFQHLSYNEIVEATGLSLENVKTRLSRARGMLRRKLESYYRA